MQVATQQCLRVRLQTGGPQGIVGAFRNKFGLTCHAAIFVADESPDTDEKAYAPEPPIRSVLNG
jgi:hypothetical protein